MSDHPIVVTKLAERDGYWQAHVSCNGTTLAVDRKHGSWRATAQLRPHVERWPVPREVLPNVAAALQAKVRPQERKAVAQ